MGFNDFRLKSGDAYEYKVLIGGKWRLCDKKFEVTSPYDGKVVGTAQLASMEDLSKAIDSAYSAKEKMANLSAENRSDILFKAAELVEHHREDFINLIISESGKPRRWVEGEVHATIESIKQISHKARDIKGELIVDDAFTLDKGKIGLVVRQPLGVVLAISPFNYPLFTGSTKIASAIAAGNSVIAKPASDDPLCLLMFAAVMQEAGVPDGGLNVVTCSGKDIGDTLVNSKKIHGISFTGSTWVGEFIAKNAGVKKLMMELGGKSPAIVLDDADLDIASEQVLEGALKISGQRCDSFSRVLVMENIADDFVSMMADKIRKWHMGDPSDAKTLVGPLINQKAVSKVSELVDDAVSHGATLVCGGKSDGLFYHPTILDNVNGEMKIAWEETFGPVVTVIRVNSADEAVRMSNLSEYGLDAAVFTKDLNRAMLTALRLDDGTVQVNGATSHGIGKFPFGGYKSSGFGSEGIGYTIEEMMKTKSIVLNLRK